MNTDFKGRLNFENHYKDMKRTVMHEEKYTM